MENEIEMFKEQNKMKNNNNKIKIYPKINKIILFQIINLIILIFVIFLIMSNKKYNLLNNKKSIKSFKFDDTIISDKIKLLKLMTNNNEYEYKGVEKCLISDPDEEFCIYHLIYTKDVLNKKRVLIGEQYLDGSYVLLDDFENIKFAYSFGIDTNIQFDKALADKGINIYMYDHTINYLPYENEKFHWKKIGLCGKNEKKKNFKNLEDLITENGHTNEKNMILKIDIEHDEWQSLIDIKEDILNQFKYIIIEYHFKDEIFYKNDNLYYNVLKKISKTHQSFYVRCNIDRSKKINFGNNRICQLLEVSYIIKKDNIFKEDKNIYPMYEFELSKPLLEKSEMNLNILKLFYKESI